MGRLFNRCLNRTLVLSLTCLWALWLFAWLLPMRTGPVSQIYDLLFMPAFFCRVYIAQIGALGLALGVLLALQRAWRWVMLAGLLALTSLGPEIVWRYTGRIDAPGAGQRVRIVSLNLQRGLNDAEKAVLWAQATDADVIVAQELTPTIAPQLERAFSQRFTYQIVAPSEGYDGLGIYSRWPITETHTEKNEVVRWIPATLHTPRGDVELYDIHLTSPQTPAKQHRMRDQVGELCRLLALESRPVILIGDFNSTPFTPLAMALRSAGLADLNRGRGLNATWPTHAGPRLLPGVRIDTAYYRGPLSPRLSLTGPAFGSDHLPILVELQLQQ